MLFLNSGSARSNILFRVTTDSDVENQAEGMRLKGGGVTAGRSTLI